MRPNRISLALASAVALLVLPQEGLSACDIAECNPQVCDPWRASWTINDFPAHQTESTPEQRDMVGDIARIVANSRDDPDPIVCLRLIGHASSFRNISADEYDRRAEIRGETIAEMLTAALETHGLRAFTVHRDEIDNDDAFCGEVLGSDVTLIFDGRGNGCPLVSNMVNSSSSTARANRAINRRVTIYSIRDAAPIDKITVRPTDICENDDDALCAVVDDFMTEGLVCAGTFAATMNGFTRAGLSAKIRAGTATRICGQLE